MFSKYKKLALTIICKEITFTILTNFTPTTGSVQGGLELYICGTGFGDDSTFVAIL